MPCRIAVYEENDATVISTINMSPFIELFKSNQIIFDEATKMFESILQMIESLK